MQRLGGTGKNYLNFLVRFLPAVCSTAYLSLSQPRLTRCPPPLPFYVAPPSSAAAARFPRRRIPCLPLFFFSLAALSSFRSPWLVPVADQPLSSSCTPLKLASNGTLTLSGTTVTAQIVTQVRNRGNVSPLCALCVCV